MDINNIYISDDIFDIIFNNLSFNEMINLSTKHKKPIGNGIITCLNKKQALNRSNLKGRNKGEEATKAIISLLDLE